MSDLSPEERAFLETVRAEWGPCPPKMPSLAELGARRSAKPWLEGPIDEPVIPRSGPFLGVSLAVIALCAAGYLALRGASAPPTPSSVASAPHVSVVLARESQSPPPASVSVEQLPDAPPLAVRESPREPQRAPAPGAARRLEKKGAEPIAPLATSLPGNAGDGTLGEELALIRAAQRELRAGKPDPALHFVATHATRFPHGVLRDERMTLQALALCARGDVAAARDVKSELERSSPGSSHLQRLADSCAR